MTTGTSAQAEAATVAKGTGTDSGTPSEPFLRTPTSVYLTAEDAAKGVAEKDKALQQAQAELDRIKREAKQADALNRLSDSISQMNASAGNGDREREQEELLKRMKEEVNEDPSKAVEYAQGWIQSLDSDYERKLKEQRDAITSETQKELDALKQDMKRLSMANNPVYRDHQDKIQEAMAEFVVDEETAIKIVSKLVESAPEVDQPPGTTGTRVQTATAAKAGKINPNILAFLEQQNGRPISEDERAAILEKRSQR